MHYYLQDSSDYSHVTAHSSSRILNELLNDLNLTVGDKRFFTFYIHSQNVEQKFALGSFFCSNVPN